MTSKVFGHMKQPPSSRTDRVAELLQDCSNLFKNKNSDYKEAYIVASDILAILVPDKSVIDTRLKAVVYHNMTLVVGKLIRASNLIFNDSKSKVTSESTSDTWRDISVYSAMISEVCENPSTLEG